MNKATLKAIVKLVAAIENGERPGQNSKPRPDGGAKWQIEYAEREAHFEARAERAKAKYVSAQRAAARDILKRKELGQTEFTSNVGQDAIFDLLADFEDGGLTKVEVFDGLCHNASLVLEEERNEAADDVFLETFGQ